FGNELVDPEGFRLDVGMDHCKPVGLPDFVAIEGYGPENIAVESDEAKSGYGAFDRVLSRVVLIEVLCATVVDAAVVRWTAYEDASHEWVKRLSGLLVVRELAD